MGGEKIKTVIVIKISAERKYMKALIVLSKLCFLPKIENSAKTNAPERARTSPEKLVNVKEKTFP